MMRERNCVKHTTCLFSIKIRAFGYLHVYVSVKSLQPSNKAFVVHSPRWQT